MPIKRRTFEVTSGKLVVSDPLFERDDVAKNLGTIVDAMNGKWKATINVSKHTGLVTSIKAIHEGSIKEERKWKPAGEIIVDTAQAGIFDGSIYPTGNTGKFEGGGDCNVKETFYGKASCFIVNEKNVGVIDGKGIISPSGAGDGKYPVFIEKDGRKATAIKIKF